MRSLIIGLLGIFLAIAQKAMPNRIPPAGLVNEKTIVKKILKKTGSDSINGTNTFNKTVTN
ncbi:MAG: hypothetical protein ACJ71B_10400 [Nitrososphaera sp.]